MPLFITIYFLHTFISEPYQHHVCLSNSLNFHLNINSNWSLPTLSLLFSYFENDQRRRSTLDANLSLSLSLIFASWRNATVSYLSHMDGGLGETRWKICLWSLSLSLHCLQIDPQLAPYLSTPQHHNPTLQGDQLQDPSTSLPVPFFPWPWWLG
jgi:hypothetical protein